MYKEQCEKGEHKSTLANTGYGRNVRLINHSLEHHS